MLIKFAIILAVICLVFRWAIGKWPWEAMQSKPSRRQTLSQARKLLRVEDGSNRKQILAAHKRLISVVHPDKGGSNAEVHEANDARDLLLDELPNRGVDLPSDDAS